MQDRLHRLEVGFSGSDIDCTALCFSIIRRCPSFCLSLHQESPCIFFSPLFPINKDAVHFFGNIGIGVDDVVVLARVN